MKTIVTGQSLSNGDIFRNRRLQKIKKLYKHYGKCDNQQQFKHNLEATMVSIPKVFTGNSPISPMTPPTLKKPSVRKSLCLITKKLNVKNKTTIY